MPTPRDKLTISIKSTTATTDGDRVEVVNLTRNGIIEGRFNASKECLINPLDSQSSWASGDDIIVQVQGRLKGYQTAKLKRGGVNVNVTTSADADTTGYATAMVNL